MTPTKGNKAPNLSPNTTPGAAHQTGKEGEIIPTRNGCHYPRKTKLVEGDAMSSLVDDIITSRSEKMKGNKDEN